MTNRPRTENRKNRVRDVLARRQKDLTLVVNNIHDPHNVSAILRSCDAFGVSEINLLYTSNVFPALGKKSSASAKKWVGRVKHTDAAVMKQDLEGHGFKLVRTGFSPTAVALKDWDFTRPTAVILGNEHSGVEKDLQDLVDNELYIPMQGMVQSLNVSVAAAIILYEAFRQRNQAGLYSVPSLSEPEIERYFQEWIEK